MRVLGRAEWPELLRESSPDDPPIWNMGFLPTAAEVALMFSILWLCSLDEQDPPRAKRAGCFLGCTGLGAGEELGSGKTSCEEAAAAGSGKARAWTLRPSGGGNGEGCETSEICSDDCDSVVVDPDRVRAGGAGGTRSFCFVDAIKGDVCEGADRGALSLTIDTIIFSKSSELMRRSRLVVEESSLRILGRISRGAETEVKSTVSSSAKDSTLPES